MMAYMINLNWFGMVIAFATVVAFLADVLVAPALMVLVTRRRATGLRDLPANDLQPR
jgi:hypothetical protein